jgi:hypothetical protein
MAANKRADVDNAWGPQATTAVVDGTARPTVAAVLSSRNRCALTAKSLSR